MRLATLAAALATSGLAFLSPGVLASTVPAPEARYDGPAFSWTEPYRLLADTLPDCRTIPLGLAELGEPIPIADGACRVSGGP
jgi:hypothetical protein